MRRRRGPALSPRLHNKYLLRDVLLLQVSTVRVLGRDDLHSAIVPRDIRGPLGVARDEPKRQYPTHRRLGRHKNHLWAGNTGVYI